MIKTENFQKIQVSSQSELRSWLNKNHSQKESVWLVTYKKSIEDKYLSNSEVLDELLCFGWIDGIRRKLDDDRTMQLISPRKTQHWTQTYKDRAARLQTEGKMMPAGLEAIHISKKMGLWNFMDDVDKLIKPEDLQKALEENPEAQQYFDAFNDSSKRNILRWIKLAKTPQTRLKRIRKTVELAAVNEKIPGS